MGEEYVEKMRKLDEAEQLLSACSVRSVVSNYQSHMEINRMILEEARRQVEEVEQS